MSATRSLASVAESYPLLRLVGESHTALVDGDDREVPGQRGHQRPVLVPVLGPAVDEQQRRSVAADDDVLA